jgi:hypothetical protein
MGLRFFVLLLLLLDPFRRLPHFSRRRVAAVLAASLAASPRGPVLRPDVSAAGERGAREDWPEFLRFLKNKVKKKNNIPLCDTLLNDNPSYIWQLGWITTGHAIIRLPHIIRLFIS